MLRMGDFTVAMSVLKFMPYIWRFVINSGA